MYQKEVKESTLRPPVAHPQECFGGTLPQDPERGCLVGFKDWPWV